MATYKEIFGKQVKFLSTDPANAAEGQIWYNSTSDTFKTLLATEAWSAGASLATSRQLGASAGTQTAALMAGGQNPSNTALTEEYNGSGWSTGGDLTTPRSQFSGGFGLQTAAVAASGYTTTNVTNSEEYDGSAWTAGNAVNTARREGGGAGILTAGVIFGG